MTISQCSSRTIGVYGNASRQPSAARRSGTPTAAEVLSDEAKDKALESRFITEETGSRGLRRDIPINLPLERCGAWSLDPRGRFERLGELAPAAKLGAWIAETHHVFRPDNARNDRRVFGIKQSDRLSHMYVIGKTGTGKSTLLERLVLSDIEAGEGLVLVDPTATWSRASWRAFRSTVRAT